MKQDMNQQQIRSEIQEIFRDILGQPALVLHEQLTAAEVRGWDSFMHVSLIDAVERHFGIRFGLSEMDGLANVGELFAAVERKLSP